MLWMHNIPLSHSIEHIPFNVQDITMSRVTGSFNSAAVAPYTVGCHQQVINPALQFLWIINENLSAWDGGLGV